MRFRIRKWPRHPVLRMTLVGLLVGVLTAGCAALGQDRRFKALENAADGYRAALRWGDHDMALQALPAELRDGQASASELDGLRITRYDVLQPLVIHADGTATQTVAIEYLFERNQVLRRVTDRQTWRWEEGDKGWKLHSGLPDFSGGGPPGPLR